MIKAPSHHQLAILSYPGAQQAAIYGLEDLFNTANKLQLDSGASGPTISVRICTSSSSSDMSLTGFSGLLIPPSLAYTQPKMAKLRVITEWIKQCHDEGAVICSVCAGTFLLAETGILAGRKTTTHWILAEQFRQAFENVPLDIDQILIDDGDVITAGGVMAWTDLGLRLIDRFLGSQIMLATARIFLIDPVGRQQRFYATFQPKQDHGDPAIAKVQRWIIQNFGKNISISILSSEAELKERTFLRRFKEATNMNPTAYIQNIRVAKAWELLELTYDSIETIAWSIGYTDTVAFNRVFKRIVGLSPGVYRKRFSVAGLR